MKTNLKARPLGILGSLAVCSLLLVACSDDDNDNDPQTVPDDTSPALTATELLGTWSTGCILDDVNDPSDGYEIETVSFSEEGFTASAASFSDAACSVVLVDDDDVDLQGVYTLGGAVTTADGQAATEIDFIYTDAATAQQATLLDLVSMQNGSLLLGEGDFDDLLENDLDARPGLLDVDEPYLYVGAETGLTQDDSIEQPTAEGETVDSAESTLAVDELTGTWSTGCVLDDPADTNDGYEIESVTFAGDGFTASAMSFSDAGCTVSVADDDDVNLEGTFSLGAAVTTASGLSATEIDFSYTDTASGQSRTLLDLIAVQDGSLYLGEGDFDELLENDFEPRPVSLDMLEPYLAQP